MPNEINEQDIMRRTDQLLMDHLGVEKEKIKPDAILAADLGADSLDKVELVMAFEEEFGIEITDPEAEKIKTVAHAYAKIAEKLHLAR